MTVFVVIYAEKARSLQQQGMLLRYGLALAIVTVEMMADGLQSLLPALGG